MKLLGWLEDLLAFGEPLRASAGHLEVLGAPHPYSSLRSAILHAPTLARYDRRDVVALEWLAREIDGRHDAVDDWVRDATSGELLARALAVVGRLLDHDLALARCHGFRSPADLEGRVLRVLVDHDRGLSSNEIAKLVTKSGFVVDDGAVQDAIGRLRHECGFAIPNGRSGYSLFDSDRDHAARGGISRVQSD
jgi:hypothetical protein